MDKVKIGIIGCGNISGIYLNNCTKVFDILEVAACADIIPEKAQARAKEYGVPKACSVKELLDDPAISIVLNLTIPRAHADICMQALTAGKHVYVEKPLAITREDGQKILRTAKVKNLRVGCAPDTFMGGGLMTCRRIIDDGLIGAPIAATAFMMNHGHEGWHPDPDFYYKTGGGPMFDMGPYYLTALVSLLGPVRRVTGSARITFPKRVITSKEKYGTEIDVEVPTHIAGIMDFENGAIATIITSFDVWASALPRIEIYGTEGMLSVPDPNCFEGPVSIRRKDSSEWTDIPVAYGFTENSRGLGVADMAQAIIDNRDHRASGELGYHVLEIMHGFIDSSNSGTHYHLASTCRRP